MSAIRTPDWVRHAVFYQVFPDRFAKSDRVEKPAHLQPWGSPPTGTGYQGGDLLGVAERLDHVQDLGATALYFTPIFESPSNHRYHTQDYYRVDPMLGGNAALRTLLDEAHRRGMRVVLDGVFNHTGRGFFPFVDILENGRNSAWLNWFTIEGWPLAPYDGTRPANYASWAGHRALPRLNTDDPQVRESIMRVAEHWLREGIDGWRLDVPYEITAPGFWQEFRERVKAVNPEAYLVGEIWTDARPWLDGTQFDGVMNYLFTEAAIAFTAGHRVRPETLKDRPYHPERALTGEGYARRIDELLALYPWEIQLAQLNLLDSHDTARLLNIAGHDRASVRLATLLLMTYPGAPSVYYGDEIGLPGELDPDCRRAMPWDRPDTWDREVLAYHRRLIALRHAHPALRTGAYHRLHADADTYAFARAGEGEALLVALNVAGSPREIAVPAGGLFAEGAALEPVFGGTDGRPCRVEGGRVRLALAARDGIVLRANPAERTARLG